MREGSKQTLYLPTHLPKGSKQSLYLPTHLPKGSKQTFIFTYLPKWNSGDKQIIFGLWDFCTCGREAIGPT
jgi:hypothetical protein